MVSSSSASSGVWCDTGVGKSFPCGSDNISSSWNSFGDNSDGRVWLAFSSSDESDLEGDFLRGRLFRRREGSSWDSSEDFEGGV